MKVAVISGSLRKGAYSTMLADAMCGLAPKLQCERVEIRDLPLYNPDLDTAGAPRAWVEFRDRIRACDAVLFVTPEYNRSVPGGLKNAIDVGSRPYGHSVWSKKPAAVVSQSPGAISGFGANHHLRQSMVFLDMPVLQQPEAYIGNVAKLFGADGKLASDETRDFLRKFMEVFAAWIARTGQGATAGAGPG
jgi:chromate reductase